MPAARPYRPSAAPGFDRRGWFALYGALLLGGTATGYWIGVKDRPPAPTKPPVEVAAAKPAPQPEPEPEPAPEPPPPPKPVIVTAKPKPKPITPKPLAPKPAPKPEMMDEPEMKPEPKPAAPPTKPAAKPATAPVFATVMPIFQAKCVGCHGMPARNGYDMRTVMATLAGGNGGRAVVPGEPDRSYLWERVENDSMPPDGRPKLTPDEKKLVYEWIKAGAK